MLDIFLNMLNAKKKKNAPLPQIKPAWNLAFGSVYVFQSTIWEK